MTADCALVSVWAEPSEPLLSDVPIELARGRVMAVLGESGAGKTLLLKALNGTLPAPLKAGARGQVVPWRAADTCLVPQYAEASLPPGYSALAFVEEVLSWGAQDARHDTHEATASALLSELGLPVAAHRRPLSQLSGGMARRVLAAAGIARSQPVLLLDEPTIGIDLPLKRALLRVLQGRREAGARLVIATHDLAFARGLADTVILLRHGRAVFRGPWEALSQTRNPYVLAFAS